MKKVGAIICLLFFNSYISCQSKIQFQNISLQDGLSHGLIFEIIQDQEGFLWFGSADGLNRFDGHEFEIFRQKHGDSTSLQDNSVWALYCDNKGTIWVGTDGGGLSRYHKFDETFKTFRNNPNEIQSLSHNTVNAILEDVHGNFWIGTYGGGLNLMNKAEGTFKKYRHNDSDSSSLAHDYIHFLFQDASGNLWIGTQQGLSKYDHSHDSFVNYTDVLPNANVLTISESEEGYLWLGTWGEGLVKFDPNEGKTLEQIKVPGDWTMNRVAAIYKDNDSRTWAGFLGSGLCKVSGNDVVEHKSDASPTSIGNNNVWIIFEDLQKNLWLGTEAGVSKVVGGRKPFYSINAEDQMGGLVDTQVYSLKKDDQDQLWIASEGALQVMLPSGEIKEVSIEGMPKNPDIWSSEIDKSQNLWLATYGSGLFRFNLKTQALESYEFNPSLNNSLLTNNISYVFESHDGSVWVGTYGMGIAKYNQKLNSFHSIRSQGMDNVLIMAEDSYGYLWIGTYASGIFRMDMQNENIERFIKNETDPQSLSHNTILCLFEDSNKNFWIGTDGGGLNLFKSDSSAFDIITTADGLPSDVVQSIEEDSNGNLWISTNAGITRYELSTKKFTTYTDADGLSSLAFNSSASFKDEDGILYFGSGNGIDIFHPDSIKSNQFAPKVYLTDLKILNESITPGKGTVLENDMKFTDKLKLTHLDKVVSVDFVALDYTNPTKVKYAYKLHGFDDKWIEVDADNRRATYTNLNSGDYKFEVRSTNSDGIWSDNQALLNIYVAPPPWLSWWAYLLYSLVLISLIFFIIRIFLIRERLKTKIQLEHVQVEKMRELDELKTHFFTNISHEFRTPLTLILAPLNRLIKKSQNTDKKTLQIIQRNANRLLGLINEILELSKIEAGQFQLRVSENDILEFIKQIAASFESIAQIKEINFLVNLPEEPISGYFDKEKLEKILTNLLSNAFKFTDAGHTININVKVADSTLQLQVQNTGVTLSGEEKEKVFDRFQRLTESVEGSGVGLALVKELVNIHKGQIGLSSENDVTQFSVSIPINREVYSEMDLVLDPKQLATELSTHAQEMKIEFEELDGAEEKALILVVEDNKDLRHFLLRSLESSYAVKTAHNGVEGLELALKEIPDLIVTDFMMPKMDGLKMLHQLRADQKTNHIPIIMLTAKADFESKLLSLEKGADHYVTKPFEVEELEMRIKSLLMQRERVKEHYRIEFLTSPTNTDSIASADDVFLQKVRKVLDARIQDTEFSVELFASELAMSRVQLHRKLKAAIGCSASDFIRQYRLKRAYYLLSNKKGNVSEIAYDVGFNNLSYFTKCFKDQYKINPSDLSNQ